MKLNADLGINARVHAAHLPWIPSPSPGVQRRLLHRDGEEAAIATSIVHYAPGSRFPLHAHPDGEEFVVLEGTFSDERGHYPAGHYVRNPHGSSHAPFSDGGCVIFVHLRQIPADDAAFVRLTMGEALAASEHDASGFRRASLHRTRHEHVETQEWPADAAVEMTLSAGGEFFVLDGDFVLSHPSPPERFGRWSWLRLAAGERLSATSGARGCRLWIKTGHLSPLPHRTSNQVHGPDGHAPETNTCHT